MVVGERTVAGRCEEGRKPDVAVIQPRTIVLQRKSRPPGPEPGRIYRIARPPSMRAWSQGRIGREAFGAEELDHPDPGTFRAERSGFAPIA